MYFFSFVCTQLLTIKFVSFSVTPEPYVSLCEETYGSGFTENDLSLLLTNKIYNQNEITLLSFYTLIIKLKVFQMTLCHINSVEKTEYIRSVQRILLYLYFKCLYLISFQCGIKVDLEQRTSDLDMEYCPCVTRVLCTEHYHVSLLWDITMGLLFRV